MISFQNYDLVFPCANKTYKSLILFAYIKISIIKCHISRCNKKVVSGSSGFECSKCVRRDIQECDTTLRFNVRVGFFLEFLSIIILQPNAFKSR